MASILDLVAMRKTYRISIARELVLSRIREQAETHHFDLGNKLIPGDDKEWAAKGDRFQIIGRIHASKIGYYKIVADGRVLPGEAEGPTEVRIGIRFSRLVQACYSLFALLCVMTDFGVEEFHLERFSGSPLERRTLSLILPLLSLLFLQGMKRFAGRATLRAFEETFKAEMEGAQD